MAIFDRANPNAEGPVYQLFRFGPILLFRNPELLKETIDDLRQRNYVVHEFDCKNYTKQDDVLLDMGLRLGFPYPDGWKPNLNGFNDLLRDTEVPKNSGFFIVFINFDTFHRQFTDYAHKVLEVMADHYQDNLLFGNRFMCLVQTNDPMIEIERVGARPAWWNNKEWLRTNRMP